MCSRDSNGWLQDYEGIDVLYQKTLSKSVKLEGIGLHSGQMVRVELHPAPADSGVYFVVDGHVIKAACASVFDTTYATSLMGNGRVVRTVEHLLAALAGLGVDNVRIEVSGSEVPILDGSAWPFVKAMKDAGLNLQRSPRKYLKILKPVTVLEGDKSASLLPSPEPRITYRIDFAHPLLSDQHFSLGLEQESFEHELCQARTFGFLRDVEMLQKAGLAQGGSLDNAVVMDDERILNEEGLRYPDEFVRHKMMDAVGDLSLLGLPFIGHLVADKSGHKLNHRLVREVLSRPDSWILVEGGIAVGDAALGLGMATVGAAGE